MGRGAPDLILCWVGRTREGYARKGISDYLDRVRRYRSCRVITVREERQSGRYTSVHRLEREGRKILGRIQDVGAAYVVAVDPRGRQLDSAGFARLIQRQCYEDSRSLAFVVGGPDGLAPAVRDRADRLLGLSRMTLPHDMARLVLVEQLYRAFTLVHGQPYAR